MSQVFVPKHHTPRRPESLGGLRPSGDPFRRQPGAAYSEDAFSVVDIDTVIGENEETPNAVNDTWSTSIAPETKSSNTEVPESTFGVNGIAAETARLRFAAGDTSTLDLGEASGLSTELAREKYNRSLRTFRALGRLARQGTLETAEAKAARENVVRDLVTSLAEMFENGEEFRGGFEISDIYDYTIVDNHVQYMTADGPKQMRQVTEDGAAVSRAAAKVDPLMIPQAERDEADVYNAQRVDAMAAGKLGVNTRLTISRDLGEIIQPGSPHRELYLGKGYRDGLAFIQLYFAERNKMTAGTFSIDGVSDKVFDAILARRGMVVPDGGSRHDSVKYGVELTLPNKAAAVAFAQQFRKDCYALQGDVRERRSANQFINERQAEINQYIDALCLPLAVSTDSGMKDKALHDFVGNLLLKPDHMKDEVVNHLRRIYQSEEFTDDDGRLLSGVILYAIAEALYKDAKRFIENSSQPEVHRQVQAVGPQDAFIPEQIIRNLVQYVHTGVEAGRTHSGPCPGEVSISNKAGDPLQDPFNLQGAFGGREGEDKESGATDKYGSMKFKCPNTACGKDNLRDYNQLRTHCQHCRKEIPRCGPSEAGEKGQEGVGFVLISKKQPAFEAKKSQFSLAA